MKKGFILILAISLVCSCSETSNLKTGNYEVELDGVTIEYSVKGKGPVMIVGHLNSGKIGYEMTLSPLEEHFTMVYYSPRGTGNSSAPENVELYHYEYIVNEIELLRKHLKTNKIWLFGHSDQSMIALQYAIDYPKNIEGLILSGTHYVLDPEAEANAKRQFQKERENQPWFKQVCDDWDYMNTHGVKVDSNGRDLSYAPLKWWCYDSLTASKVIPISEAVSKAGRRKPVNGEYPFNSQASYEKLLIRDYEYQDRFNEVHARTLILQGKYDTYNPPELAMELDKQLPNSKLVFIDSAGHFPFSEQEQIFFDELLKWYNK
jgi:proline iminopeptidase